MRSKRFRPVLTESSQIMDRRPYQAGTHDQTQNSSRGTGERLRKQAQAHVQRSKRYTAVAIACALLHNGIMIGLDRVGVHYVLCQTASAAVLLPVGYLLQSHLTFRAERSWRDFFRYSAALLTNFPVAIVVLWVLCDLLTLDMIWASPISMAVLFVWNYLTSAWAFARRSVRNRKHG
jgi:putative flippase GtrA